MSSHENAGDLLVGSCMFVLLWCDKCTLTPCLSANHDDDRREKDTESSSPVDADEHVQNASPVEPLLIADEGG
jgi:hypothetical protein